MGLQIMQHKTNLKLQEEGFEVRLKKEQEKLQKTLEDLHKSNVKADEMRTRKVLLYTQDVMVWLTSPEATAIFLFPSVSYKVVICAMIAHLCN